MTFLAAFFLLTKPVLASIPIEGGMYAKPEIIIDTTNEYTPRGDKDYKTYLQMKDYALYNRRGKEFYKNEDYENAISEFKKAVEFNSNFAKGYNNLGLSYFMIGRLDSAEKAFEKAIMCNQNYFEAYNNLGSVYLDSGDYKSAIRFFRDAKKLSPESEEVESNLKQALALKEKRDRYTVIFILSFLSGLLFLAVKYIVKRNY